ncbi:MAG: tetratricopeptide repeat protein, partial [Fimbriimonas sp.]
MDTEAAAQAVHDVLGKISGHGQVVVTSRLSNWKGSVRSLALDVLLPNDAAAFLLERTAKGRRVQPDDAERAHEVGVMLGQLALMLEQAGAYIVERGLSFGEYVTEWQSKHAKALEWWGPSMRDYPVSVAVTWQTTVDQLSPAARHLLELLAWLAPDPIPMFLLDSGEHLLGLTGDRDARDALGELARYHLVERHPELPQFTVHLIVQDVTRHSLRSDAEYGRLREALGWVNQAFVGDAQDVRSWPTLVPLAGHVKACAGFADRHSIADPTSRLLNQVGILGLSRAQYAEAEPLMRRALEIDEKSYGKEHPNIAIRLNNLASLLQASNRLEQAEPLMTRALKIDEKSYGNEHPKVAIRLNNLATLLYATNRLEQAEPIMRRALEIDEKSYGKEQPIVATRLNNLAQ